MVIKFYPRSLGVDIYTRRELARRYKTRMAVKSGLPCLALHDKATGDFVCFAGIYRAKHGQRTA